MRQAPSRVSADTVSRPAPQGPYGNYGKVDDYKILASKKITKGKRDYRRVRRNQAVVPFIFRCSPAMLVVPCPWEWAVQ